MSAPISTATDAGIDSADWPVQGLISDVRTSLEAMLRLGPAALATVTAVTPSGPRPPGTQMVVGALGAHGFLSGGCVEADVALHARACLADRRPRRLIYGEGGPWPDIRLACGARLEVLVEAIDPDDPAAQTLLELRRRRRPAVWVSDGERRTCAEVKPAPWDGAFTVRHDPAARLVVVGGDPISLAIADLGARTGFETTLVRPRGPAAPPPLAGVAYDRRPPREALIAIGLDPWTAVAACCHDADLDQETLLAALPSAAGYVGLLGARSRLDERLAALRAVGLSEAQIGRLKAPIGLNLGGKAPFEIALAVLGEIIASRGRPLA